MDAAILGLLLSLVGGLMGALVFASTKAFQLGLEISHNRESLKGLAARVRRLERAQGWTGESE